MKKTVVLGVMAALTLSIFASMAAHAAETHAMKCSQMAGMQRPSGTMRENLKTLKSEMLALMSSRMPDKVKAEKLIGEMNDLHGRMMTAGIDKIIDAKRILTAEQNKIVGAKIEHARLMMERWPSTGK